VTPTDPIATEAAAHVHAVHLHALRTLTAIRHADPILAAVELQDVRRRVAELDRLILDQAAREYDGVPADLRPCRECGAAEALCRCGDVPFAEEVR